MSRTHDELQELPDWMVPPQEAERRCTDFIRAVLTAAGYERVVVGLSGGIDSAVSAALAARALGAPQVLGVLMPYRTSAPASEEDARDVADRLGIPIERVDISRPVDALLAGRPDADRIRRGNVMARARMTILYDISSRDRRLVLGTGNRTEALLGYTTLHGDSACSLNPLGRLYKAEVRALARHLGLPPAVLTKAPSADLWAGQSDEEELGFTYAAADRLLHHLLDEGLQERQLAALGFSADLIRRVAQRVRSTAFKRVAPPVAEFPGRPDPDRPRTSLVDAGDAPAEGGIH
ncbi:MAG: NAD+ synthase [Candidatus Krumholzibacteriia bacterium]